MYEDYVEKKPFYSSLPPGILAALILAVPFMVIDFFNYYTAGTVLVFSGPILALIYIGCGALAAYLSGRRGHRSTEFVYTGATAGLSLWLASTIVNTVVSLVIGAASLGVTLLFGIPYLCLCAPFQLVLGGVLGMLGGFLYKKFGGHRDEYLY
jgi:hypothetical protein